MNLVLAVQRRIVPMLAVGAIALLPRLAAATPSTGSEGGAALEAAGDARYNVVAYLTGMDNDRLTRAIGRGELRLNADGTFALDVVQARMDLVHSCPVADDVCRRAIQRRSGVLPLRASGTYVRQPGEVLLHVVGAGGAVEDVRAWTDRDGSIMTIPFVRQNGLQLAVALRRAPTGDAAQHLSGRYAWSRRSVDFSGATGGHSGAWPTHGTTVSRGEARIGGHRLSATLDGSRMSGDVTCQGGAPCLLSSTLEQGVESERVVARVKSLPDGGVSLSGGPSGVVRAGYATPDGEVIVLGESDPRGRQALSLLTRAGTDMSTADLSGEYGVVTMEEFLDTSAHVRTFQPAGEIVFDGAGNWSFSGANITVDRGECSTPAPADGELPAASCGTAAIGTFGPFQAGAVGTYSVAADGDLTQQGVDTGGGTVRFTGNVSADGRVFVLRRIEDSMPCTFFCSGSESVRSIVIGVRRN